MITTAEQKKLIELEAKLAKAASLEYWHLVRRIERQINELKAKQTK
tara:strand:+ start:443 stop:580 length:138 start_codon:yes stop_codon:yes gene_type:complete